MDVLVSVIVPVFNTELHILEKCIISVLEQTFQSIEIIIVNDCSTKKDLPSFLFELEARYEEVKVIHNIQNKGIAGSRNVGLNAARGKWVCFLDHDDWLEEECIQYVYNYAESKNTDMVVFGYKMVNESGFVEKSYPAIGDEDFAESPWFIYGSSAPWNRLIRRSFLLENCIRFPEKCLTEDITFNIRCNCLAHLPLGIPYRGYCNRINKNSLSRSIRFVSMSYSEMPFGDIEKNLELGLNIKDSLVRRIHEAAIGEQLASLVCLFSYKSEKLTKRNAQDQSSKLIHMYMTGYVNKALEYGKHMDSNKTMLIIYWGYMFSVRLRMDHIYCTLVYCILRFLKK